MKTSSFLGITNFDLGFSEPTTLEFAFFIPPELSLTELKLEAVLGYTKQNEAHNEQKICPYLFSFITFT